MANVTFSLKSSAYRSGIQITRFIKNRLNSLEADFYKRLSYQSRVTVTLPFSKRKILLSVAGDISKVIYVDGLLGYEGHSTQLWADMCKQADLILDIGSHIGLYSILAADTLTEAQIHAFEPVPENFSMLSQNIKSSGYESLINAHSLALSNVTGETQMVIKGSSGSTLEKNFWLDTAALNQITIPVDTLDLWLEHKAFPITSRSLIKLDVETHEPAVLDGAKNALNAGPAILCEVLGTFTEHLLSDLLPAGNWRYFWIGPDGPVERRRIIGDPDWKFPNYLFISKDSPFGTVVDNFK